VRDSFHDLETYCPTPLQGGTHRYAEKAEVLLWSYALEDDIVKVWDRVNGYVHWIDDLSGLWQEAPAKGMPADLELMLRDRETLVWFQNGGHFDFVVLKHAMPQVDGMITKDRRRDTMVQAFSHALPGSLDKLGTVLNLAEDDRKIADGRRLVQLFCKPQGEDFVKKWGTDRATKQTHPAEWQRFIQYAGGDITTMRAARRLMPQWNYKGKQVELWYLDCKINNRGFAVDVELAEAAVRAAEKERAELGRQTREATKGAVNNATQRDELLAHILAEYGVTLPDMQSDTLERRLEDPELPEAVKDLLRIRLQASRNSAAKFKRLLKGVSSDGRLRGCAQFRGAGRTGRWAHRLFQPGNMMRPTLSQEMIDLGILSLKTDCADLIFPDVMEMIGNTVRGAIIAPPGRKLVIADLSNIEGRVAAWLAGEEWKLQAFRDFDSGTGVDLYILAYAKSFNVPPADVPKKGPERQIGKVEELMFQYGGGVGAWLTGAATYGIDLDKMTEQVWDVLPQWAKDEAQSFLEWLYEKPRKRAAERVEAGHADAFIRAQLNEACLKARFGLTERTFVACDAIKRLWRTAHPRISSYWKELEDTVRLAIDSPGSTFPCRKVKIRRDGAWLRIGLPSGRALCYPNPKIEKDGSISYVGQDTYSRKWCPVKTYGGKLLENITQAVACDQLAECMPAVEAAGYEIVMHVHDELITETPDTEAFSADQLAALMCSDLGWNDGLPLAAAGFETLRYRKD
jgi:DNA polymerase